MASRSNTRINAGRNKKLLIDFYSAKLEGAKLGDFDIQQINEDSLEEYYILLKPKTGLFRDQAQILHMKTSYGSNEAYCYPINAPLVKFITSVYHTNVSRDGSICLDVLKDATKWMPTYDFVQIINNIMLLYQDPNTSSPFNGEASSLYSKCRTEFNKKKTKGMPLHEEEKLFDECFVSYKKKADTVASSGNIANRYAKWFPQLTSAEVNREELKNMEEQLNALTKKKLKPEATEAKKKPKANRWAKYQKKKPVKPDTNTEGNTEGKTESKTNADS